MWVWEVWGVIVCMEGGVGIPIVGALVVAVEGEESYQ